MRDLRKALGAWLERHMPLSPLENVYRQANTLRLVVTPRTNLIVRATPAADMLSVYTRAKLNNGYSRCVVVDGDTCTVITGSRLAIAQATKAFSGHGSQLVLQTDYDGTEPSPTVLNTHEAVLDERQPEVNQRVDNPVIDIEADVPMGTKVIIVTVAE